LVKKDDDSNEEDKVSTDHLAESQTPYQDILTTNNTVTATANAASKLKSKLTRDI